MGLGREFERGRGGVKSCNHTSSWSCRGHRGHKPQLPHSDGVCVPRTTALHVVGTTAYVADKDQGLEIVDVSDSTSPALLGTFTTDVGTSGVRVTGDVAFIIHWERGLVAVDVRDPAHPVEIGSIFDGGRPNGLWIEGDLIYVADGTDGLEILRFRVEEET